MNICTAISGILLASTGVTDLVGSDPTSARIWNSWERVNAYPCIVIEVDSDDENPDLSGASGLTNSAVAITCRANGDADSQALWKAVRTALIGYSGGGLDLILNSTTHSAVPKAEGSTAHWYDRILDFTAIWMVA